MTPLHQFGEVLRQAFSQVPMGVVRVLFVAVFLGLLIWVLCLPNSLTTREISGGTSEKQSENLKLWAVLALAVQVVIYLFV